MPPPAFGFGHRRLSIVDLSPLGRQPMESADGRHVISYNGDLVPMQPGDVRDTFADVSAIRDHLGFAPTSAIEVGVPHFVDWYRSYRRL